MNKNNKFRVLSILLILTMMVLSACSSSSSSSSTSSTTEENKAQEGSNEAGQSEYESTTIRLASALPINHHLSVAMEDFAKKVTERSRGKVNVQLYPAGQLVSDKEMNDALLTGGIEMGIVHSSLWSSTVPAMSIFDVPFALPNQDKVHKAVDGEIGKVLNEEMEKKGAKVLMFADYGLDGLAFADKQVKLPEDMKGLTVRASGIVSEMVKAFGAAPVSMGGGEVYMALQKGTIDGATVGPSVMLERKYSEVSKYATLANYSYVEFIVAVNKSFWDKLPQKTQELITSTANEVRDSLRAQVKEKDEDAINKLKELGMEIYEVPEADVPKWKEASQPVRDIYLKNAGEVGEELLNLAESIE